MIRRPPPSPLFPYPTLFRSLPTYPKTVERLGRLIPDAKFIYVIDRKITRLNTSHSSISYAFFTSFIFFNDTATPAISPLSLPDALPISPDLSQNRRAPWPPDPGREIYLRHRSEDHTTEHQSQFHLVRLLHFLYFF